MVLGVVVFAGVYFARLLDCKTLLLHLLAVFLLLFRLVEMIINSNSKNENENENDDKPKFKVVTSLYKPHYQHRRFRPH